MTFERKISLTQDQQRTVRNYRDQIANSKSKIRKLRDELDRLRGEESRLSEKYDGLEGTLRFDDAKGIESLSRLRTQLDVLKRNIADTERQLKEALAEFPPLGLVTKIVREFCYPDYEKLISEVASDFMRYYLRSDLALQAARQCELTRLYIHVISQDFGGILDRETAAEAALLPLESLLAGISPFKLKN